MRSLFHSSAFFLPDTKPAQLLHPICCQSFECSYPHYFKLLLDMWRDLVSVQAAVDYLFISHIFSPKLHCAPFEGKRLLINLPGMKEILWDIVVSDLSEVKVNSKTTKKKSRQNEIIGTIRRIGGFFFYSVILVIIF